MISLTREQAEFVASLLRSRTFHYQRNIENMPEEVSGSERRILALCVEIADGIDLQLKVMLGASDFLTHSRASSDPVPPLPLADSGMPSQPKVGTV